MLKIAEVAKRLNISNQAVVEAGKIPSHRFGLGRGTIRISEEDLAEYISACRCETAERIPRPAQRRFRDVTL